MQLHRQVQIWKSSTKSMYTNNIQLISYIRQLYHWSYSFMYLSVWDILVCSKKISRHLCDGNSATTLLMHTTVSVRFVHKYWDRTTSGSAMEQNESAISYFALLLVTTKALKLSYFTVFATEIRTTVWLTAATGFQGTCKTILKGFIYQTSLLRFCHWCYSHPYQTYKASQRKS